MYNIITINIYININFPVPDGGWLEGWWLEWGGFVVAYYYLVIFSSID